MANSVKKIISLDSTDIDTTQMEICISKMLDMNLYIIYL